MCKEGECLECMQIDRSQLLDYLNKIARYLINEGIIKTDDMTNEEVFGYVVETVSALRAEVERLRTLVEQLAPEEAMNQDEQGGCVWCGWSESMMYFSKNNRSEKGSMYADERPETHTPNCAWRLAREYINNLKARP